MSDVEQETTEQPVAEKDAAPAAGPNRVEQEAMEQPLDDHDDAPAIPNRKKEISEQNRMLQMIKQRDSYVEEVEYENRLVAKWADYNAQIPITWGEVLETVAHIRCVDRMMRMVVVTAAVWVTFIYFVSPQTLSDNTGLRKKT